MEKGFKFGDRVYIMPVFGSAYGGDAIFISEREASSLVLFDGEERPISISNDRVYNTMDLNMSEIEDPEMEGIDSPLTLYVGDQKIATIHSGLVDISVTPRQ